MKKNVFKKFNILDIAIIIIVIALLLGSVLRTNIRKITSVSNKTQEAVITLTVKPDMHNRINYVFKNGSKVYFSDNSKTCGVLLSNVRRLSKNYVVNSENKVYDITYGDKNQKEYVLRIETTLVSGNEGSFINGERFVSCGSVLQLETDNASFEGTVTKITVK